jgi:proline dehydrogenase
LFYTEIIMLIHSSAYSIQANIPFSVFKVTGLARFALLEKVSSGVTLSKEESDEYQRVRDRVNSICKEAC